MIHPATRERSSRGVALVVVLWGLVLVSIIAGGVAVGTRTDTTMAFNVAENAKARALAEAGIQHGILEMAQRETSAWLFDGTDYPIASSGGEIAVSLQDELGKIDLNTAPDELMQALFRSVDLDDAAARALADAVADFRDEDDLVRLNGAEARDYRAARLSHEPKNAPFEAIEELRLVLGMSEDLFRKVAPLITVYSRRPWVNLATAPRGVLLALPGLDDTGLERILEQRLESATESEETTAPAPTAPAVLPTQFGRIAPPGAIMTVRAEARTAGGGIFVREAIVRTQDSAEEPYDFLDWRQGVRRAPEQAENGPETSSSQ
jgi:general secretion pathway protein K